MELLRVACQSPPDAPLGPFHCELELRRKDSQTESIEAHGTSPDDAVKAAVQSLCSSEFDYELETSVEVDGLEKFFVTVHESAGSTSVAANSREGMGRYLAGQNDNHDRSFGLAVALLRAVQHAGLLKAAYRANNQKIFRGWASQVAEEVAEALEIPTLSVQKRLQLESLILEHSNRVASAAVVTAANHPRPDSVLSLFDTSAWLFDSVGRRRDSYTDTDLWLAWYPGVENHEQTVQEVIDSMPKAPPSKIPWIVRLFENPDSWIRFRGAVDLEDHDIMHVLLGRGLQDQDEAFIIGFAMGTAKKVSWFQYWVFKFVIGKLYPEPYRIPRFLQPAFDLGVRCGQETGVRDLYKQELKRLLTLPLREARKQAGIDMQVVQRYFEQEQQRIPFTIASLRLP
ncbi:MAG: hypothetical protein AB8B50_21335 [Pirellulaceae bacterium]